MRRKKQLLMAMLCAFSMMINSAAVVAQSKDKQQKSSAQQAPEPSGDVFWIGAPAQEADFLTLLPAPAQEIAYAAPQVEFISHEFNFDGKVVKGAPYSADAVTETIQMLGDGNRIIQNSSAKIYRDSAGRTRREHVMKAVGPWAVSGEAPIMISINDPVSNVHYNLNSSTKTAHKMSPLNSFYSVQDAKAGAELRAKMQEKLKAANGAEAGVATGVVNDVVIMRGANAADLPADRTGIDSAIVTTAVTGPIGPGVPASVGGRVFSWSGDPEVNRESLGAQTIEGVVAEGTRVTFTIPAGKIGNERPIITVNERWYSPELQTVVLSKNSDPRMGETTFRLTNIDRSEPNSSLFQVPADYTVSEGRGFGFRSLPPELPRVERRAKRPNDN